jgi:hypothetical protein
LRLLRDPTETISCGRRGPVGIARDADPNSFLPSGGPGARRCACSATAATTFSKTR